MRLRRAPAIVALCLLISASTALGDGTWLLWGGIETIGGPMWKETGASYPSREACQEGAQVYAQTWESRMRTQGREPERMGTDVITRTENGSILMVRFVCLPDTTDPRQR
jgi:hypothetical protein